MKPLVSLIIVNYNGFEITKKCLESLWQNTIGINFETIVVDNASDDKSLEKLQELFPEKDNLKYLARKTNGFLTFAYNDGFAISQGEIVVFMNNDIVFSPQWLKELLRAFDYEKTGIAGSAILVANSDNMIDNLGGRLNFLGFGQRINAGQKYSPKQTFTNPFYIQGVLLAARRQIIEKTNGFDASFGAYYEDVDLCWQARLMGYEVLTAQKSIIWHIGSWTVSKQIKKPDLSFFCRKNRLATVLKNASCLHLILMLPFYFLSQLILFLKECLWDRNLTLAAASQKAIFWNLNRLGEILKQRKRIQSLKTISEWQILKILKWL